MALEPTTISRPRIGSDNPISHKEQQRQLPVTDSSNTDATPTLPETRQNKNLPKLKDE